MTTQTTISQPTLCSSNAISDTPPLSVGVLAYFRGRLSNRIHELVLAEFLAQEREGKTTRSCLARRIRRKPEQVTRWFGSPGNWTLDTLSDLLIGMGMEPTLSLQSVISEKHRPSTQTLGILNLTYQLNNLFEVQTAQEVAQDIATGNHKPIYVSLRPLTQDTKSKIKAIEIQTTPALSQIHSNINFEIVENKSANTKTATK
ncbi:hypothetical protein ACLSSQ_10435 [Azospira sp. APE16]|uniref:hypothetical protein n=1 Tax=Azospira sp. APE16 TaxID=3394231 RepID=UPI003A4DFF7E